MIKYYVNKKRATMQVINNYNSEYPIGILWNMGNKYTIKDYVRKGYKSILKENTKYQRKSYISFLEDLRGDRDERE